MSSFGVGSTFDNNKKEIFRFSSVTAALKVYEDFLTYSSGNYQHVTRAAEGDHTIIYIGWGV
jgi:cathepsin B